MHIVIPITYCILIFMYIVNTHCEKKHLQLRENNRVQVYSELCLVLRSAGKMCLEITFNNVS